MYLLIESHTCRNFICNKYILYIIFVLLLINTSYLYASSMILVVISRVVTIIVSKPIVSSFDLVNEPTKVLVVFNTALLGLLVSKFKRGGVN